MRDNRVLKPLALADKIREVSKSCRNLVLQKGGGGHMSQMVSLFYSVEFPSMDISWHRVSNNWSQCQIAEFGSLLPLLIRSGNFRRVAETSFCKGGDHMAHVVPALLLGGISNCGCLLAIEW